MPVVGVYLPTCLPVCPPVCLPTTACYATYTVMHTFGLPRAQKEAALRVLDVSAIAYRLYPGRHLLRKGPWARGPWAGCYNRRRRGKGRGRPVDLLRKDWAHRPGRLPSSQRSGWLAGPDVPRSGRCPVMMDPGFHQAGCRMLRRGFLPFCHFARS